MVWALLACCACCVAQPQPQDATTAPANLLQNGSFELREPADAPRPTGWDVVVPRTDSLSFAREHYEGKVSAMLVGDGVERAWRQEIAGPTPRAYTLSAFVKADAAEMTGSEDYAYIYGHIIYKGLAYADATHFFIKIPPGTYDWRKLSVVAQTSAREPIERIDISFTGKLTSGRIYVDQVELSPDADLSPTGRLRHKARDLLARIDEMHATDVPSLAAARPKLDEVVAMLAAPEVDDAQLKAASDKWVAAAQAIDFAGWSKLYPDAMPRGGPEARILYHGLARTKEETDRYFDVMQRANVNGAYYSLGAWLGVVQHSKIAPIAPEWKDFDALAYAVPEAHRRGLKAFAYMATLYATFDDLHTNPLYVAHPDWFAKSPDPNMPPFPDPAHPGVRDFVIKLYVELVTQYDLDGVGLDYIEYPTPTALNFDENNRQAILKQFGFDIKEGNPWADPKKAEQLRAYRNQVVSSLLEELRDAIHKANPKVKILGCITTDPDEAYAYGYDWARNTHALDYASPMNYDDRILALDVLQRQIELCRKANAQWMPGIGGMPDVHQSWTIGDWARRIAICRKLKSDGIVLYRIADMDPAVIAFLGNGAFHGPAEFPAPLKK